MFVRLGVSVADRDRVPLSEPVCVCVVVCVAEAVLEADMVCVLVPVKLGVLDPLPVLD